MQQVTYPLVSDRTQEISRAYRVLDGRTGGAFRVSVFIDPDQVIVAKLTYPKEVGRNLPEHVRILQGIQFGRQTGKGVPANWVPGDPGLNVNPHMIGDI
jgi:peroxiredoxin (alkyl hydroperoxide reductase subunit C)